MRCILALLLFLCGAALADSAADIERPEQSIIDRILAGQQPQGVLLLVMEDDEEALRWVLPRVVAYTRQLRARWPELPIVLLSHGDEMFSLVSAARNLYPEIHAAARRLVSEHRVHFQLCGAFAAMSEIAASDFPEYLDVIPSAPAEIENYRLLEFAIVNLELTW